MKKSAIKGTLVALAAALVMSSCNKEHFQLRTGEEVSFSAGLSEASLNTKASYSGDVYNDNGVTRERIDWNTGDQIGIYCAQLEASHNYGNYFITEVLDEQAEKPWISWARLKAIGETPLSWGSAENPHYFYAVYPSPDYGDVTQSIEAKTDGMDVVAEIPATQRVRGEIKQSGVSYVAEPDLRNMVMTAKAGPYSVEADIPGRSDVFLSFIPLTTAIQFTITNQTKEALTLQSVSLISAGSPLNGEFSVDIDGEVKPAALNLTNPTINYNTTYPVCQYTGTPTDDNKTVTIDFGENPVVLAYDEDVDKCGKLTFTFFLQPGQNFNDLTFKLTKLVSDREDGTVPCWMSTRLSYANNQGIVFPRHKKSFVTGLFVPEGAIWSVKYDPEVANWGSEDHGEITPDPETDLQPYIASWLIGDDINYNLSKYNYTVDVAGETNFDHNGTTVDGSSILQFTSRREYRGIRSSVVYFMEYFDTESNSWKVAKYGEKIGDLVTLTQVDPTTHLPVTPETAEIIGKGSQTLSMVVDAAIAPESKTHTERLQAAAAKGTDKPYDLSMYDIYGNARQKAKTANCYIVKAQGRYAFPLVYGNAIDDEVAPAGYINVNAYNPGGETDPTSTILTRFRNYKGFGIRQPYIESDLAEIPWDDIDTPQRHISKMEVLWDDTASIGIVNDNTNGINNGILTASAAESLGLTSMIGKGLEHNACGYAVFDVSASTKPGNAVIALKDDNNDIIWSWHIWITDDDLDLVTYGNSLGQSVTMLPVNLGWIDAYEGDVIHYDGKSVKFRVNQEGSNIKYEFTVTRRPESTTTNTSGTSTYYQWGRKDPFKNGSSAVVCGESTAYDIAYSIQHPDTFVKGGYYYYQEAIGGAQTVASYYNLWSALNKGLGTASSNYNTKTIKTIYDPCPPGFQIPHGMAFTGFTTTGNNETDAARFNVAGPFSAGWHFTTGAGDESNFFTAAGYLDGSDGSQQESGTNGHYWTSVPDDGAGTQKMGLEMNFNGSAVNVKGNKAGQSNGFMVRPVVEKDL